MAAESHVDRSIENSIDFALTNVIGTVNLLNAAKNKWIGKRDHLFYHISTDEVYGSLGLNGSFKETTKLILSRRIQHQKHLPIIL